MTLERYSHVMHLTSQVAGELAPGRTPIDVLRATFPAGTVSGAPKVRAMEIIDELEPTKRGPYAGVVGYVDFSGNLDTAIAIRTMVWRDGQATLQAGAGIVADSVPADEELECRNKARALLTAAAAAAAPRHREETEPHDVQRASPVSSVTSSSCRDPTPTTFLQSLLSQDLDPVGGRRGHARAAARAAGQARGRPPRGARRADDEWWCVCEAGLRPGARARG